MVNKAKMWHPSYFIWLVLFVIAFAIAVAALVLAISDSGQQLIHYNSGANLVNNTFLRDGSVSMCEQCTQRLITVRGKVQDLIIQLYAPAAAGSETIFTMRKNGVDTDMTVTIAEGAQRGRNNKNFVSVQPYDVISLMATFTGNPIAGAIGTVEIKSSS